MDLSGDETEQNKQQFVEAEDQGVSRFRPMYLQAAQKATLEELREQVLWQANVNAGKSYRLHVSVTGWRDPDGHLWQRNTILPYRDEGLGVHRDLVIVSVDFSASDQGVVTR